MFENEKYHTRGYEIYYDKGCWRFKDTRKPIGNDNRPCNVCQVKPGGETDCPECQSVTKEIRKR
jgi:hypothetical protein